MKSSDPQRFFILDTNVLMHDPTSIFRFQEHDVCLPMVVLEELDAAKKGLSEVSRNVRQVSRFLDELLSHAAGAAIEDGLPLKSSSFKGESGPASGRLFFQTQAVANELPISLAGSKPDNHILSAAIALQKEHPQSRITTVSKDINLRIKATALGIPAEDYSTDQVLDDVNLLHTGYLQLKDDFWEKHSQELDSWQEQGRSFYRLQGPDTADWYPGLCIYLEQDNFEAVVRRIEGQQAVIELLTDYRHSSHSVWGINALNREQNFALNLLMDPELDLVTLLGMAGTGKTLLARAIAGEAKVPFFSISGSDFVEMFVGVGASRVRDMFETAKKHAPCIIFIDEIDAVGRHRGAGLGGGHDEREQTLNQLLVEMDGFEGGEGVIVIAATNRPDVLDPALLRPGRFDRQVVVPLPDLRGREKILEVHMRKVPIDDSVDARVIARGTPGFSGADLANLVNEAALFAARNNRKDVTMKEFEKAKDKIMMGAERRSMVMSEKERNLTAYHEAGHAIVGRIVPDHDPVYKVSIIPRGRALGVTMFLPEQDRYSQSKQMLESMLASLFGGRVAEEMVFGKEHVTTGASNDIERATEIARNMVTRWGLSDALGPLTYGEADEEVFLGRSVTQHKTVSDDTAKLIDDEVRRIIDEGHDKATGILSAHRKQMDLMAAALMRYETIDSKQIDQIMEGDEPDPPEDWEEIKPPNDDDSTTGNTDTSDGPVNIDPAPQT